MDLRLARLFVSETMFSPTEAELPRRHAVCPWGTAGNDLNNSFHARYRELICGLNRLRQSGRAKQEQEPREAEPPRCSP
jgi:hypothetical protein